jgi:hypothetical protein
MDEMGWSEVMWVYAWGVEQYMLVETREEKKEGCLKVTEEHTNENLDELIPPK